MSNGAEIGNFKLDFGFGNARIKCKKCRKIGIGVGGTKEGLTKFDE